MKGSFFTKRIAGALTLTLFLLSAAVILFIHLNPGMERYAQTVNSFLILEPESVEEIAIPDYAGVRRIYTFTFPRDNPSGGRIRCYLRHTFSTFYLDDPSRASRPPESERWHIGRTPGNYWLTIPMVPSLAGEQMQVVLETELLDIRIGRGIKLRPGAAVA